MDDMQQRRRREERPLAAGSSTERTGLAAWLRDGPKRGAAAICRDAGSAQDSDTGQEEKRRPEAHTHTHTHTAEAAGRKIKDNNGACRAGGVSSRNTVNNRPSVVGMADMACMGRKLEAADFCVWSPKIWRGIRHSKQQRRRETESDQASGRSAVL
jgi:hypothetical protein